MADSSGYQSRTEFIRAALREKIDKARMRQAIIELGKMRGRSKSKTGKRQRDAARERAFEKLDRMLS